ncbi:MAG: ribonuclease VapC [Methanobacteriaceae archaeon]|nr:ribonuclease VapC [Methanobacteriaceae archaeon]
MDKKVYILDASSIIGGFYSKEYINIMPSSAVSEIKDINSKMLLEQIIASGNLIIEDIIGSDEELKISLKSSGDYMRLSDTDRDIIRLALKYTRDNYNVLVVTDDYSMQNTLKILKIPFRSIITKGINSIVKWQRICKGCKKEYDPEYPEDDCEICGSTIITKRVKNKRQGNI